MSAGVSRLERCFLFIDLYVGYDIIIYTIVKSNILARKQNISIILEVEDNGNK